jgi:hypothetical protein
MYSQPNGSSSAYSFDHSKSWDQNSRQRAYWRIAATDEEVLAYATSGMEAIAVPQLGTPDADVLIKWERDDAAETVRYFETEHERVVADAEADTKPVDIDRALCLGTELAQGLETGPEAVAYATDRLKSKIERNAVYNPITEVHSALMTHHFLKEQHGGGEKKILYLDLYRQPQPEPDAKPEPGAKADRGQEAPKSKPDARPGVENMFQRVGLLDSRPREYIIKGFLPRNEACNPFGRPDSFKGVAAAQLAVHIAGGVDFLGMPVKQAPTAYFAGERADQVKRRIKGHIQRLGLPYDLPCYFGNKPIDLLSKPDLAFLIANIKAIENDAGQPLGHLTVDTQSRTMGGDENSTSDGAAYAKAIEAIRQATEATLWIIAHTGHSAEAQDRPRGSSALLGAYDTFYRFKKIDERSGEIKITIDRDGLGGKKIPFIVDLYDTGAVNEDGEPVMVPYLEAAAPPVKFAFKKGGANGGEQIMSAAKTTKTEKLALRTLAEAIKQNGVSTDCLVYANVVDWAAGFGDAFEGESDAERKAFKRSWASLLEKGLVETLNGEFFRLAK